VQRYNVDLPFIIRANDDAEHRHRKFAMVSSGGKASRELEERERGKHHALMAGLAACN